jgi:hypothetical protein
MKMKMTMDNLSQDDDSCRQSRQWPHEKKQISKDRRASHTSTETTALMTTSSAETWTSLATPTSPRPAETASSAKKRSSSEKKKSYAKSKRDDVDAIPTEIFVGVNENDVSVEGDSNPFRFETVSPDVTVTSTPAASYADAYSTAVRRNSSPPTASPLWNRQRRSDSIPKMPLPLSLRHRQHQHQHQRHAVALDAAPGAADAADDAASGPDPWMFQAAPVRRSSCPYYLGGRDSQHSLRSLQQTLTFPSIQLSSWGEGRSNTNMMTTLEIVSKAIEIAEAAVEQMEEEQDDQLCHHHHHIDDDDGDDEDRPETERRSGLTEAIGASSTSHSSSASVTAAAIITVDRFTALDVPPRAPKRKASNEELMTFPSSSER